MDKHWRPKGWKKIAFRELYGEGQLHSNDGEECFEVGASAMLETLRQEYPCYVNKENIDSSNFPLKGERGYFVFIPD